MAEQRTPGGDDTMKLLRECDAGIQMGIASIDDVLDYAENADLKESLRRCKQAHQSLREETLVGLCRLDSESKEPNPIAKGMSWVKTNVKLMTGDRDAAIADLVTDGCNMGIKALHRYLNQYRQAAEGAKTLTRRLISQEEQLSREMQPYL
jgi:hypothetical protein